MTFLTLLLSLRVSGWIPVKSFVCVPVSLEGVSLLYHGRVDKRFCLRDTTDYCCLVSAWKKTIWEEKEGSGGAAARLLKLQLTEKLSEELDLKFLPVLFLSWGFLYLCEALCNSTESHLAKHSLMFFFYYFSVPFCWKTGLTL